MAQGEYKKKSDKFPVQKKSKSSKKNKPLGPKKGGMYCCSVDTADHVVILFKYRSIYCT